MSALAKKKARTKANTEYDIGVISVPEAEAHEVFYHSFQVPMSTTAIDNWLRNMSGCSLVTVSSEGVAGCCMYTIKNAITGVPTNLPTDLDTLASLFHYATTSTFPRATETVIVPRHMMDYGDILNFPSLKEFADASGATTDIDRWFAGLSALLVLTVVTMETSGAKKMDLTSERANNTYKELHGNRNKVKYTAANAASQALLSIKIKDEQDPELIQLIKILFCTYNCLSAQLFATPEEYRRLSQMLSASTIAHLRHMKKGKPSIFLQAQILDSSEYLENQFSSTLEENPDSQSWIGNPYLGTSQPFLTVEYASAISTRAAAMTDPTFKESRNEEWLQLQKSVPALRRRTRQRF
jgi:hypothetical protein